jgi:hypothetical protein
MFKNPFNKKQKSLIYLTRTGLQVFVPSTGSHFTLEFDPGAVKDLELKRASVLSEQIKAFLKTSNITPSDGIIVISNDVLFTKSLVASLSDTSAVDQEVAAFLEETPFPPNNLVYKISEADTGNMILVANKTVYSAVAKVFEASSWHLFAIVPEASLGGTPVDASSLSSIFGNRKVLAAATYPRADIGGIAALPPARVRKLKTACKVLFWTTLFSVGAATYLLLTVPKEAPVDAFPMDDVVTPSAELDFVDESSPSAEDFEEVSIERNEISVTVLNGTGVAGLAGESVLSLKKLGYTTAVAGNSPEYSSDVTLLEHSEDVPDVYIEELSDYLYGLFDEVLVQRVENDAAYVIVITTGKLLSN